MDNLDFIKTNMLILNSFVPSKLEAEFWDVMSKWICLNMIKYSEISVFKWQKCLDKSAPTSSFQQKINRSVHTADESLPHTLLLVAY